jgi:alpha-1,2-mannosyltransferase
MPVKSSIKRWALLVTALVTLGGAIQQRHRVAVKLEDPLGGHVNDFDRWMILTPQFIDGHADYVDDLLPTPPISLLFLAPFSLLSRPNAQFVWACAKLPLACFFLTCTLRIVTNAGVRLTSSAIALVLACWWLPVVIDIQEGQINLLVMLPVVAGLSLVQNERPSSDVAAGALIGLAAAIKITPLVFALYFGWKRRWIIPAAILLSVLVCTLVVPAIAFGSDQNLRWLGQWGQIMIVPYVTRGAVLYPLSQSVGSFVLRLLTPLPIYESVDRDVPYGHFMNIMTASETAVGRITFAILVTVAMAGLVWTRRRLRTFRCERYLMEIGAVTAFMLWFSERTWVHHYVSFLVTLCAAGAVLSDPEQPIGTRRSVRGALVAFAGVTLLASDAGHLFGPHGDEWALALGVFLWPSVLVTAAALRSTQNMRTDVTAARDVPTIPTSRYA